MFHSGLAFSETGFKLLKQLLNLETEETQSGINRERSREKQSEDYAAALSCYGADTETSVDTTVVI